MALIWKAILFVQWNIFSNTWTKDLMYLLQIQLMLQLRYFWDWANHYHNLTKKLSQAMDLIYNHEIWGNKNNFTGTIDMGDPFNSFMLWQQSWWRSWWCLVYKNCARMCKGSKWRTFLVLGLICYCDKTGTDVYEKMLWSLFLLLFVYSIESAGTRLLHGILLDTFLLLLICPLQLIAFLMVDILEKVVPYIIFISVWR